VSIVAIDVELKVVSNPKDAAMSSVLSPASFSSESFPVSCKTADLCDWVVHEIGGKRRAALRTRLRNQTYKLITFCSGSESPAVTTMGLAAALRRVIRWAIAEGENAPLWRACERVFQAPARGWCGALLMTPAQLTKHTDIHKANNNKMKTKNKKKQK
jgi:hypothetical protein